MGGENAPAGLPATFIHGLVGMSNPSTKMREQRYQNLLGKNVRLKDEVFKLQCAHDSRLEQVQEANDQFNALNKRFKAFETVVYDMTATLSEHPNKAPDDDDLYDGPCLCAECRSYGI